MKPPSSIVVGPYTYDVVVDETAILRASFDGGSPVAGNTDESAQRIALDPALERDAMAECLVHELIHVLILQAPLGLTDAEGERVAHAFGYSLLDALRRNPELVSFLTAPADPTRAAGRSRHGRSTNGRQRAAAEGP